MGRTRKLPKGVYFSDSEMVVHLMVADWLRLKPDLLWCHVPNGEYRHPATGARLRRMGVLKGVSDLLIFSPPPKLPGCVGTALELKKLKGGKLALEQGLFLNRLSHCGWHVIVASGFDAAIEMLTAAGY